MINRPPLLEEPFAQTLSGKTACVCLCCDIYIQFIHCCRGTCTGNYITICTTRFDGFLLIFASTNPGMTIQSLHTLPGNPFSHTNHIPKMYQNVRYKRPPPATYWNLTRQFSITQKSHGSELVVIFLNVQA